MRRQDPRPTCQGRMKTGGRRRLGGREPSYRSDALPMGRAGATERTAGHAEHGELDGARPRCLSGTGLIPAEQMSILRLLMGYVRDDIATSTQLQAARKASGSSGILSAYREALASVIQPDAFPALTAVIVSSALDHDDDRGRVHVRPRADRRRHGAARGNSRAARGEFTIAVD